MNSNAELPGWSIIIGLIIGLLVLGVIIAFALLTKNSIVSWAGTL